MWIRSVEFSNFRNYKTFRADFDKGINLLYGDNAQGKTNILEGIYICSDSRSHRRSSDRELILFGEKEAHIRLVLEKRNDLHRIDVHYRKDGKKGIAIDGIPVKKAAEMFGFLNVVMFAPEDMALVKSGPSERRRFLDREICQTDPLYMDDLTNYNRVLEQRNRLLKEIVHSSSLAGTLDVWDEQLEKYGCRIIRKREKYLEETEKICSEIHSELTSGEEELKLFYEKNANEDNFREIIEKGRERDIFTLTTNRGPHRDDFSIKANGQDLRTYGSQGQQRTAAVSLKLSEINIIKEKTGEMPVLLLDDVFSELDQRRQEGLLREISDIQTVISGTGIDNLTRNNVKIGKKFYIKQGTSLEEE